MTKGDTIPDLPPIEIVTKDVKPVSPRPFWEWLRNRPAMHWDNEPQIDAINKRWAGHFLEVGKLYTLYSMNNTNWNLWPENPAEKEIRGREEETLGREQLRWRDRPSNVHIVTGQPLLMIDWWPDVGLTTPGTIRACPDIPEFLVGDQRLCCYWYLKNQSGFFIPLEEWRKIDDNGR